MKVFRIAVVLFTLLVLAFCFTVSMNAADVGEVAFEKRCTGCHSMDKNKEGPKLRGVYGRKSAAVGDYGYSEALKKANLLWNDETLERWLKDPESVAPDNDMAFHVNDKKEREDIIAYLKSQAAK